MRKVIDVSYYQKDLDYDAVVAAGVEGVIIKICEGSTLEATWWSHLTKVQQYNLPWGVYHFGHAQSPVQARAEANETLYLLDGKQPPLGIWYDVEDSNYRSMFAQGVDTTACASAFVAHCNAHRYSVGIYTSSLKCTDYLLESLRPRELADYVPWWIADYRGFNGFAQTYPDRHCAGWQYSDREMIGGITVDMNEWYD